MRVNLLALTVGVPRGQSLPDAGISLKSPGANRWGTKGPKLARCRNFSEIPPRENSKAVFRGKLDRPCRACRIGLTEERGTHHSDDPGDVRMIDGIERVHAEFQAPSRTTMFAVGSALEAEHFRQPHIQLHHPWAATRVARYSGRPCNGVAIWVRPGGNVEWHPAGDPQK